MKEIFKHNRIAAVAALILIIVLSLTIGVNRSVGRLANDLENVYSAADPVYGSARSDAERFSAYLNEFYSIASVYGAIVPSYLYDLSTETSTAFPERNLLGTALSDADAVYNRLINQPEITESAKSDAIRCFAELKAMRLRLKNNVVYNTAAEKYNRALMSFPANVFDFMHSPAAVFE